MQSGIPFAFGQEGLTLLHLTILCAFAFCAGMIDAVVGGGGLIQIPALINVFPGARDSTEYATMFGPTNSLR